MTSIFKTVLASALLCAAATVHCQELKIGFVNLDRVLRDAAPAKAAQAKLEGEFTRREKDLADSEARLKSASDRFEKDAPALGESERARRQRDLMEQDRELQRRRREFQEDLNQRKNEELASVLDRANRVVKQIFDQEKYDLILQEAVFAGPRVDITDKVIKALNSGSIK
ncbi:OmpH family outer membrane protein [Aquabacterium sp.]|uniref:OmpH family outer membrane protein n=1 Tax=Aquabacterium sp. TaxID=1872578 RepID=UPI0035B22AC7